MYTLLTVLVVIVCVLLILVVLMQNPKGGGLSATFGGGGASQHFGVQRTTDILEKTTWTLAITVLVLSLGMNFFINRNQVTEEKKSRLEGKVENILPPLPQGLPTKDESFPTEKPTE